MCEHVGLHIYNKVLVVKLGANLDMVCIYVSAVCVRVCVCWKVPGKMAREKQEKGGRAFINMILNVCVCVSPLGVQDKPQPFTGTRR